jgi:cellulose synthase/poly-beta-1,6-N-acetylglucosamine synthase-like glycosyltransferase
MIVAEILFWLAVALAVYTYFGYPILLLGVTALVQTVRDLRYLLRRDTRRRPPVGDESLPAISIIVPAYNEEAAIAAKIDNCRGLDYPADRLEILIGSDGSEDRTNEIAREKIHELSDGPAVTLCDYEQRRGKPSVLNDTISRATGDVLVLSDATTMIDADALRHIARHFQNPEVGAVNGELRFEAPGEGHQGEGLYWKYEVMLKFMENRLGVVLGSSGALCAVRRSIFRPIPADCICDDLVITLNVELDGQRAVYDPEARSAEETAASVEQESRRRERISAGNFQALRMTVGLLNPLRGAIAWCYASHKIFKWTTWAFMALALLANVVALAWGAATGRRWMLYAVMLGLQAIFYGLAVLGASGVQIPIVSKVARIAHYFVAMHLAMFRGFLRHLRRTQKVAWQREHR